jgi:hypothetical protein
MTYATTNPPALVSQRVGADGGAVWIYKDGDPIGTVTGADYISNGDDLGMVAGDRVIHIDETTGQTTEMQVASVTSGGAATLTGANYELTASGAVPAGVQSLELNHATVVVAATIADSKAHQGLFVVKDTSATGTAAHTLTLTAGTFNGTNNVATLNALNECLVVWFDSAGNGTIVENVGTVALS